jgi:DNA-binding protein HU-beta
LENYCFFLKKKIKYGKILKNKENDMKKSELIDAVASKTSLSKTDVDEVIKATIDTIVEAVAKDDKVSFIGFGSFERTTRAGRKAKIPGTDKIVDVPESKSVKFKVGKQFKESVNK